MKIPFKQLKRKHGFSLLEVLFAIFLAFLLAMLFGNSIPVAVRGRVKADLNNRATSLAQKQLEAIKGLGYANLTAAQMSANNLIDSTSPVAGRPTTFEFTNSDGGAQDSVARVLQGYSPRGYVTIDQVGAGGLDLRRAVIEVQWTESGRTRTIRLGTLVANI